MNETPPIISVPNFICKTLRILCVPEGARGGPERTLDGGFACEVSVIVWKDISQGKISKPKPKPLKMRVLLAFQTSNTRRYLGKLKYTRRELLVGTKIFSGRQLSIHLPSNVPS